MLQEFVDQIENTCRDIMNEIHTALPGEIDSIDLSTGRATVKPVGSYKKPDGSTIEYPQITGVPIMIPQCVQCGIEIAFPVKKGESCLVIISEQELDAWLYGEESESELRFDLTSAVCIPGLSAVAGSSFVEACKTDSAIIANGDVKVVVSPSKIKLCGDLEIEGEITATGNLKVKGNITATGTITP